MWENPRLYHCISKGILTFNPMRISSKIGKKQKQSAWSAESQFKNAIVSHGPDNSQLDRIRENALFRSRRRSRKHDETRRINLIRSALRIIVMNLKRYCLEIGAWAHLDAHIFRQRQILHARGPIKAVLLARIWHAPCIRQL
jgi:hypothetical protein